MRKYLDPLISNPGVIRITVMPAMPKVRGNEFMLAKNAGVYSTPVRIK